MLERIRLRNVALAPQIEAVFGTRLNVLTGDNGLGKSLLLDAAWWALTRTWVDHPILPQFTIQNSPAQATIEYEVAAKASSTQVVASFEPRKQDYKLARGRPTKQGIVVYVRIDGGFSVWDPARNYWRTDPGRPSAYHFSGREVWDGLDLDGQRVCEGLERDWVSWQKGGEIQFEHVKELLRSLAPPDEPIVASHPGRVLIGEGRDRPFIEFAGTRVPLAFASAGVRRAISVAYVLVWAWHEHIAAAAQLGESPEDRMILLFDEPETHLHPKWQRTIIPALMQSTKQLRKIAADPQFLIATHSPLVTASLEPHFDVSTDRLLLLTRKNERVELDCDAWARHGDVLNWLVSDVFGLAQGRSAEAERAIEEAEAHMRGEATRSQDQIQTELARLLPDHDPFWARWVVRTRMAG